MGARYGMKVMGAEAAFARVRELVAARHFCGLS